MKRTRTDRAFTLIEILVVITVIAVLVGFLMSAVRAVSTASKTSLTTLQITSLHGAMEAYVIDQRYRLPPRETDGRLHTTGGLSGTLKTLDLLEAYGALRLDRGSLLGDRSAPEGRYLVDGWSRPIRYEPDVALDGTIDKPAPLMDWNGKSREPYPYVWSLGKPSRRGDVYDADPARADRWIYRRTTP